MSIGIFEANRLGSLQLLEQLGVTLGGVKLSIVLGLGGVLGSLGETLCDFEDTLALAWVLDLAFLAGLLVASFCALD